MKRFIVITLIFTMVFVLTACKSSSAVIVGTDEKEYELVEDKNGNNESAS